MAKYHEENVEKLLSRHVELEQSETKTQATLVTILSLTQITELKLLLDIGRSGHSFYDFVLTLLLASICLEIFIGIIIIYVGNLHYYHATYGGIARRNEFTSSCSLPGAYSPTYRYEALTRRLSASGDGYLTTGSPPSHGITGIVVRDRPVERHVTSIPEVERLDENIEKAQIRMADVELKTIKVSNNVMVLEEAIRKSPGNATDLLEAMTKARNDLSAAGRERDDAESERRAAEAEMQRALVIKQLEEERQESAAYRRISYWQQIVTYALYFVMIMNIFVTTFGISGGSSRVLITRQHHVVVPLRLSPQSVSSTFNTTNYH